MSGRWEVQTLFDNGGWENCWHDDERGKRLRSFASREEAERELREFVADMHAAAARGDIEDFNPDDYRVALLEPPR